ncbi:ester cyclase [Novosphingobium sp.]|uniref:ester cyclase n=1 Tax=Novosphingobium sp. TaxID=1874826 RepID=UPI003BAA5B41
MTTSSRAELAALAERYLAVLASGAIDQADAIFAPDVIWHFGAGMTASGLAGWQAMVGDWLAAFPDLCPIDAMTIIDAETATFSVRMRWRATHRQAFMGLAATDREVENEGVSVFRVAGGRIVEEWIFEDVANLVAQLGDQSPAN